MSFLQAKTRSGLLGRFGIVLLMAVVFSLTFVTLAWSSPAFFAQIPESFEQSCNLCHSQPPSLNEFGNSFKHNGYQFAGLTNPAAEPEVSEVSGQVKQEPKIALVLPEGTSRGDKTQLQARVTADGKPVKGAEIEFLEATDLFIQGKMSLGTALTDDTGNASINYWPRAISEKVTITAKVKANAEITAGESTGSFNLALAGPLVEHSEGLHIPFVGTWLVLLIVVAVWGAYAYVAFGVLQFPRYATTSVSQGAVELEEEQQHA